MEWVWARDLDGRKWSAGCGRVVEIWCSNGKDGEGAGFGQSSLRI